MSTLAELHYHHEAVLRACAAALTAAGHPDSAAADLRSADIEHRNALSAEKWQASTPDTKGRVAMSAPTVPANTQLTTPGGKGDLGEVPQGSVEWLNANVRVGYTAQRGNAWWLQLGLDGEPVSESHFPGPVPIEAVEKLFALDYLSEPVFVGEGARRRPYVDRKGVPMQAITHPVTGKVFKVFTDGYQIHSPLAWFVDKVAEILDTPRLDLGIGSVGYLDEGAKVFTQIELPANIAVAGLEFRPSLLSFGSFDGSLSSTYKWVNTVTICGNSFRRARGETGAQAKVKHTRNSAAGARTQTLRDTLGMQFEEESAAFAAEIEAMAGTKVTDQQWQSIVERLAPVPDIRDLTSRGAARAETMARTKRDQLSNLYYNDLRAATWVGTKLGAVQAASTWRHHFQAVKGAVRPERNYLNAISSTGEEEDARVDALINAVLARG